jgi:hypothetical protein
MGDGGDAAPKMANGLGNQRTIELVEMIFAAGDDFRSGRLLFIWQVAEKGTEFVDSPCIPLPKCRKE